jgi:hypothetical protein
MRASRWFPILALVGLLAADATMERPAAAPLPATSLTAREIAPALHFAAAQMHVAMPRVLPRVERRTIDQITALDDAVSLSGARSVEFYDGDKVLVLDVWDGTRFDDASALVHGVVHWLQDRTPNACRRPCDCERQAYTVQAAWLARHGKTLADVGVSNHLLARLTRCDDAIRVASIAEPRRTE